MSYQARVLPPAEWGRLEGPIASLATHGDPSRHRVLVVERNGAIVGAVALLTAVHAEFLEIDPACRGNGVALGYLRDLLLHETADEPAVWMSAETTMMRSIMDTLGSEIAPGCHYILDRQQAEAVV